MKAFQYFTGQNTVVAIEIAWKEKFGKDFEIQCDELVTKPRSIFQRLDTHTFVRDHEQRGKDIYHFYRLGN